MGLIHVSFGNYKNAQGKITHKIINGKLVAIKSNKNNIINSNEEIKNLKNA